MATPCKKVLSFNISKVVTGANYYALADVSTLGNMYRLHHEGEVST